MKMPKPTEAEKERFAAMVPDDPRVEIKPMFGNLGAFVNGNMFMGLFGADVGVKLPADELADLLGKPGAGPFGPAERPMGGYATLPPDLSAEDTRDWTAKALRYVGALPPKAAKKKATARKS
ncbi:TfoX/Sxy family protein [Actinophytocola sp.]|uniref:TfoX/Sxy family protein n=1 Tax=Actinophytocola sp. TaxID=1872138 RepID=UPI002ED58854